MLVLSLRKEEDQALEAYLMGMDDQLVFHDYIQGDKALDFMQALDQDSVLLVYDWQNYHQLLEEASILASLSDMDITILDLQQLFQPIYEASDDQQAEGPADLETAVRYYGLSTWKLQLGLEQVAQAIKQVYLRTSYDLENFQAEYSRLVNLRQRFNNMQQTQPENIRQITVETSGCGCLLNIIFWYILLRILSGL